MAWNEKFDLEFILNCRICQRLLQIWKNFSEKFFFRLRVLPIDISDIVCKLQIENMVHLMNEESTRNLHCSDCKYPHARNRSSHIGNCDIDIWSSEIHLTIETVDIPLQYHFWYKLDMIPWCNSEPFNPELIIQIIEIGVFFPLLKD